MPDLPLSHFNLVTPMMLEAIVPGVHVLSTIFFDNLQTIGTDHRTHTACFVGRVGETLAFIVPSFSALGVRVDLGDVDPGTVSGGKTDVRH